MGLAITSRLVQAMGGQVCVESEPGKGATFHFTVQLPVPEQPILNLKPAQRAELRGIRALVVDDNATNRSFLVQMLTRWGMTVAEVNGGAASLQAIKRATDKNRPYDLVLLDCHMPEMDGFEVAQCIQQDRSAKRRPIVIMLTSASSQGNGSRCHELGITAYLLKPIRESELLDAIRLALGTGAQNQSTAPQANHHVPPKSHDHIRVLLAEDNKVNQRVALRFLEKRGYSVVLANDGQEALDALTKQPFHVVLMDVQMPNMDGFEATKAVRNKEKATGDHLPIIAMTAHALKGDEERCSAAGMDGYVSKPITMDALFAKIDEVMSSSATVPCRS